MHVAPKFAIDRFRTLVSPKRKLQHVEETGAHCTKCWRPMLVEPAEHYSKSTTSHCNIGVKRDIFERNVSKISSSTKVNERNPRSERSARVPKFLDSRVQCCCSLRTVGYPTRISKQVLVHVPRHLWSVIVHHRPHRSYDTTIPGKKHPSREMNGFFRQCLISLGSLTGRKKCKSSFGAR